MPNGGYLTLSDVFNPLQSALAVQQLDEARTRSRLQTMQQAEYQKSEQAKNDILGMWQNLSGQQPQGQPQGSGPQGMPSQASGGSALPQPQMQQMRPQQPQAQPQQPQGDPVQTKFNNAGKVFKYAVQTGNDALLQQVLTGASNDPDLAPIIEKMGLSSLRINADKDLEQTVEMTPEKFATYKQKTPSLEWNEKNKLMKVVTDKNGFVKKFEPAKEEDKLTDEQIVYGALREKLGREPKKQELMKAMEEHKKRTSIQGDAVPFGQWSKGDKEWWFETKKSTGEMPRFGFGDRTSYNNFNREYADWARGKGVTGKEAKTESETFKADSASIKNQTKVRDIMGSFTKNLDFQVSRLKFNIDKISRTDARILNLPIREALMKIKGSASESILSMYLTDISNDIAKLSTGSSASVRELSKDAQERWAKIHDPNLPIKDILDLVSETRTAAHGRMSTADAQIAETRARMEGKTPENKPSSAREPQAPGTAGTTGTIKGAHGEY